MRASALTGTAAAVTALAVVLSGCGSDTKTAPSSSSSAESSTSASKSSESTSPTSEEKTSEAPGAPAGQTIDQYIAENGIVQTVVGPGENGAPNVILPTPEGWEMTCEGLSQGSYGGIRYTGPDAAPDFPPTIFAYLSSLDGEVDPATLLELAPNDLRSIPDYVEASETPTGTLGGFDAYEVAGTASIDGKPTFIAQKTVLIPGADGLMYLLQLNAYAKPDQQGILGTAVGHIDAETTIE